MADIVVGHVATLAAVLDLLAHFDERIAELLHFLLIFLEQVQHEPQSCFFANARQFGELVHSILDQLGGEVHHEWMEAFPAKVR